MFENITPESLKNEMLGVITGLETRDGSFLSDMFSPAALQMWNFYMTLKKLQKMVFIDENSGEYIDMTAEVYGLKRKAAAPSSLKVIITAPVENYLIPAGTKIIVNEICNFFTALDLWTVSGGSGFTVTTTAVSEFPGEKYNMTVNSIRLVGVEDSVSIQNIEAAAVDGRDTESDERLYKRIDAFRKRPATSGNIYHYEQWALEVGGVGAVKVTPCERGAGTVGILIASDTYRAVSNSVITECKNHIDSVRPVLADVYVESVSELAINVAASVNFSENTTLAEIKTEFNVLLQDYLERISFKSQKVIINEIGALLMSINGVNDYSNLKINNFSTNITIGGKQVPVKGTVNLT